MKIYVIVILTLIKLVASAVDEELQTKYLTMTQSNFVEHFNEQNYSWKIKQYSNIINLKFDNTYFHDQTRRQYHDGLTVKYHNPAEVGPLPENFDSREKWPSCHSIGEIYDQIHCDSCWTHGVANTASDRTCIHTNKAVYLSEQDLECEHENFTICTGGVSERGFLFWKENGLVTRKCKPYQPLELNRRVCEENCVNPFQSYELDKHYAQEIYSLLNDDYQIKAEIYLNGPIKASMIVYEDFQHDNGNGYYSGIYVHTHGDFKGLHSVRVIGYGVENGIEYWLAANSWSSEWGENGFFRIKRFQEDILFENRMCTGIPELSASN